MTDIREAADVTDEQRAEYEVARLAAARKWHLENTSVPPYANSPFVDAFVSGATWAEAASRERIKALERDAATAYANQDMLARLVSMDGPLDRQQARIEALEAAVTQQSDYITLEAAVMRADLEAAEWSIGQEGRIEVLERRIALALDALTESGLWMNRVMQATAALSTPREEADRDE